MKAFDINTFRTLTGAYLGKFSRGGLGLAAALLAIAVAHRAKIQGLTDRGGGRDSEYDERTGE